MKNIGKVLITGGSGLIGQQITDDLLRNGIEVSWLTRTPKAHNKVNQFKWDVEQQIIDESAFEGVQTLIHLAGASIAEKRWTEKRKDVLIKSRRDSTILLEKVLKKSKHSITTYIGASAIGYYGNTGTEEISEEASKGDDFLSEVCSVWEDGHHKIAALNIRTCINRIGLVASRRGGFFEETLKTKAFRIIPYFGNGHQLLSPIHIKDISGIIRYQIEQLNMEGTYNLVSPISISSKSFSKKIARICRAIALPVPLVCVKIIVGELANVLGYSNKISSKKVEALGYQYEFKDIDSLLKDLLS